MGKGGGNRSIRVKDAMLLKHFKNHVIMLILATGWYIVRDHIPHRFL